jgi:hypothetical protein
MDRDIIKAMLGAGHFFVSTMGGGFRKVAQHLRRLEEFRDELDGTDLALGA